MFDCSSIFDAIRNSTAKIIILQGGTSSTKTVSALQEGIIYACFNSGKVITVTGESIPNLKKGAYRDAEWLYASSKYFQKRVKFWNKSDRIIYLDNESIIEFISNIDEQSSKAGKRDRLIVDEANGVAWKVFFQMAMRTREKVVVTYNPSAKFWAHEKLIGTTPETNELTATVETIISDHRHNPFLSQEEHDRIEGIKDKELWKVYARGETGNLMGTIFPEWLTIPDADFPTDKIIWGIDFGYTNDPTALVKISRVGESLYVHECCYESGVAPKTLIQILKSNGYNGEPIYSEHDPDMISQLRRLGMTITPARKGQGSVNAGIMLLKQYKVFITQSSKNLKIEQTNYSWMQIDGNSINTPVDNFNHLIDATRYGIYSHYFKS